MSGYRRPFAYKAIGNVKCSQHIFGQAEDISLDENPQKEIMDDLNRDGEINYNDAALIFEIIDDLSGKPSLNPF